ncbi:antibiotic biosynthesis monooxygenase family protein [Amycolatopsis aidingensis]|uniref:antibiotic biosynthesis monooxygenase family protein n=1 Tax=Amycolatopsis aidingensis TaxID=2842453 RepID=UPI001C0CF1A1|nr:antibiotic biosynthesis monooxygenase [Amycolatopsis aidingensis]
MSLPVGGVRVLIYNSTPDLSGIESAYHRVSEALLGTPGLLGNELLRSLHDPAGFVIASSWESVEAFREWERGADHRTVTAPLRRFRDTSVPRPFGVYQVSAAYHEHGSLPDPVTGW